MNKTLIIGGMGYIGSTVVDVMQKSESYGTATIIDPLMFNVDPSFFHRTFSNGRFRFLKSDVSDMRQTWEMIRRHDTVVYMASLTMPATAKDPEEGIFVNRSMAEMVGDCCARLGKRMVFMSTCSNYGRSDEPINEAGELLPVSMYARTKVDAERYLVRRVPNVTILRCATAYGVGAGRTRWDVILNDFVNNALASGVIDVFKPDACRPICHVRDIARAVCMAMVAEPRGCCTIYNVGGDSQNYTKRELADMVAKHTDADIQISESADDRDYTVDFGRIRDEMGFDPTHTPDSAIPRMIKQWRLENHTGGSA